MGIELSQILIDRTAKSLKVKREIVAKTDDSILNFPSAEFLQIGAKTQLSMFGWTNSKNEDGGLYAVIIAKIYQIRPARARLQAI